MFARLHRSPDEMPRPYRTRLALPASARLDTMNTRWQPYGHATRGGIACRRGGNPSACCKAARSSESMHASAKNFPTKLTTLLKSMSAVHKMSGAVHRHAMPVGSGGGGAVPHSR